MSRVVFETWAGQGNETGGLHRRARIDPTCQMGAAVKCGKPATVLAIGSEGYYHADYWCPEHAALFSNPRGCIRVDHHASMT